MVYVSAASSTQLGPIGSVNLNYLRSENRMTEDFCEICCFSGLRHAAMGYNCLLQIVGHGVGQRTWSEGKPSSHKLIPSGVSGDLFF